VMRKVKSPGLSGTTESARDRRNATIQNPKGDDAMVSNTGGTGQP
jgi:hypothetical protein